MKNAIYTIIGHLIIIALIVLVFKLFKWHAIVEIDPNNHSMEPEYKYGSYDLDISAQRVDQLGLGTVVAYYVPGNSALPRVAYVVAVEGQHVAVQQGKVMVNERPFEPSINGLNEDVPAYVVPRGCAVLYSRIAGEDSSKYGPFPMRNIVGRLK